MKLIIYIDEYDYSTIINDERYMPLDISVAIKNGTLIPDNATNIEMATIIYGKEVARDLLNNWEMSKNWWNAPYQKGGKE